MKRLHYMPGAVGLILILLLTGTAVGVDDACRWLPPDNIVIAPPAPEMEPTTPSTYTGTIRVFVAEIIGRWDDNNGIPFHNALLAFALEENIALNETDSLTWELLWDGHDYYDFDMQWFDDIQEDNIKVIAAVFNSAGYTGYSDPPGGGAFTVHDVDACAGAKCGATGYNLVFGDFTHSVYDDDGVTTW